MYRSGAKLRGIFFDRDGTLCENGSGYVGEKAKIVLCEGAKQVIAAMKRGGYELFLITNQSGVGRGFFPLGAALACNRQLTSLLGGGKVFSEICVATGTPDRPDSYRKPSPRFIWEMCEKYNMDAAFCWVIGDDACDLEMAKNAGVRAIIISRNATNSSCHEKSCHVAVPDLESAWAVIAASDCENLAGIDLSSGNSSPAPRQT